MVSPSIQFRVGEIRWIDFRQRILPGHKPLGQLPVVVRIPQLI